MKIPLTRDYIIDWLEETAWALVIGAVAVAAPVILATDIEKVEDWETWGVALGLAVSRVAVAIGGNAVRKFLGIATS